jgi:uncharacterized metal-binding protein YceD (DUF177 family)
MNKPPKSSPWSAPILVRDIPQEGQHYALSADAMTCARVAELAGVREISRLAAEFDAIPRAGGGLRLTGEVTATVGQTCVVTLDPMQVEVAEPVDLVFVPAQAGQTSTASEPVGDGEEPPEPLIDGAVDLGAIATEFLLLGIDPYPRKADAVFAPPTHHDRAENPFAALEVLKKGSGKG